MEVRRGSRVQNKRDLNEHPAQEIRSNQDR